MTIQTLFMTSPWKLQRMKTTSYFLHSVSSNFRKLQSCGSPHIFTNITNYRMKAEKASVATSVSVEFFTGYHFISSTSKDFWYHSWHRDHNVILHVSKVRSRVYTVCQKSNFVLELNFDKSFKFSILMILLKIRAKLNF